MKLRSLLMLSLLVIPAIANSNKNIASDQPNIIFILSDDLGWGDLGCFGQKKIKTPNIDQLGREGLLFSQAYAGSAVCAPSRSSLMQGMHQGHARVRGNAFNAYRESLQSDDYTLGMFMQEAGYKTGIFGKWGLANHDQPGTPNQKGFDAFFGYLNQRHAHCYYPEFLYENNQRVYYPENGNHFLHENYSKTSAYSSSGDVIPPGISDPSNAKNAFDQYSAKSLDFVRANHQAPFFMYLAYTLPHGPLISPTLGTYHDKDWALPYKEWAAMVTHMDAAIGELMQLLKELKIDQNTLIIFASDNGDSSHGYEARYREVNPEINIADFFQSSSPTRGQKGGTFDGSFHVPALAWWPNHIEAGQTSDHLWAFWDVLPTLADVVGKKLPVPTDGISFIPTLLNRGEQEKHP